MKNIGIWLDKDKAHVVTLEKGNEQMNTVMSNMEHFNIHGGSGTRLKGGPQDVVQDSKLLEREKQQHKAYFKALTKHIVDANKIVLFGPAQTMKRYAQHLERYHPDLSNKVQAVHKADSMTDNQVVALIREFYNH